MIPAVLGGRIESWDMTTFEAVMVGAMLMLTPGIIAFAILAWRAPELDLD